MESNGHGPKMTHFPINLSQFFVNSSTKSSDSSSFSAVFMSRWDPKQKHSDRKQEPTEPPPSLLLLLLLLFLLLPHHRRSWSGTWRPAWAGSLAWHPSSAGSIAMAPAVSSCNEKSTLRKLAKAIRPLLSTPWTSWTSYRFTFGWWWW